MILLLGILVLWVLKMDLPQTGKSLKVKAIFRTYKSNENTSYLNAKLIKTVTMNVHKSNGNRNYSYEMVNVLKASGEGRFFL